MRVLCTAVCGPSHGRGQLPLLRALAAAGHKVHVVTMPSVAAVFQGEGLDVISCMPDCFPVTFMDSAPELATGAYTMEEVGDLMMRAISGPMARHLYKAVLPVVQELRPHMVLRDGMDLSACLVAERLGVPHLPTPSGRSNILDPGSHLPELNAVREGVGLSVREDPLSFAPYGRGWTMCLRNSPSHCICRPRWPTSSPRPWSVALRCRAGWLSCRPSGPSCSPPSA